MKLTPDRIWLGTHSYTLTCFLFVSLIKTVLCAGLIKCLPRCSNKEVRNSSSLSPSEAELEAENSVNQVSAQMVTTSLK